MTITTILLAVDLSDANEWLRLHPQPGNGLVVTPSNVKWAAGRGLTADRILETDRAAVHGRIEEMREATAPCLSGEARS